MAGISPISSSHVLYCSDDPTVLENLVHCAQKQHGIQILTLEADFSALGPALLHTSDTIHVLNLQGLPLSLLEEILQSVPDPLQTLYFYTEDSNPMTGAEDLFDQVRQVSSKNVSSIENYQELLQPSFLETAPLPTEYYFDEKYWKFRKNVERTSPRFIGVASEFKNTLRNIGDYQLLESENYGRMLIKSKSGLKIRSNVCRHQHALIVDPQCRPETDTVSGNLQGKTYACPVHAWRYSVNDGTLQNAPHFQTPVKSCLPESTLHNWNGMLFESSDEIESIANTIGKSGLFDPELLNLNNYSLVHKESTETYQFSLELYMRVFFDLYHVHSYHESTLATITDCPKFSSSQSHLDFMEFGSNYSLQVAEWKETPQKMTANYKRLSELVARLYPQSPPPFAALWLAIYPGFTIEWYPHVLIIADVRHQTAESCTGNIHYLVKNAWLEHTEDILSVARDSFKEWEDEDLALTQSEHNGQKILWEAGDPYQGPLHKTMESGVLHYYSYIRSKAKEFGIPLAVPPGYSQTE